jgi:hypothetical protein
MATPALRFDPDATLRHIESRLNPAPRDAPLPLIQRFHRDRPPWANGKDLTRRLYDEIENTVARGVPRWAAVIHANQAVWRPGPHTSGAQVVYDAAGRATLEAVIEAANRCAETKHGERTNPEELRLGEMLADEMERALDWPLPPSISSEHDMFTSIAMLPRENTPYRFMAMTFFPVLADPESRLVALVPHTYWDESFLRAWKREAIKTLLLLKLSKK